MIFWEKKRFSYESVFFVLLFQFCCFYFAQAQKLGSKGRLIGIVSSENNEKLVGASVIISGVKTKSVVTDVNGEFEFDLESGNYILTVSYTGYATKTDSSVVVKSSEVTRHPMVLFYKNSQEVVITGRKKPAMESVSAVFAIQKNNRALSDVISIEQIRKSPDINVNESLKRINGVTVVDNKYVVVRGMGERYNSVLLNGSLLPSTEANKKNFSFDILPNNIIDNIVVNKTATPDLPADFSGGLIQVTTKQVPDKNYFSILVGTGMNTLSTNKEFISTDISKSAYSASVPSSLKWYQKTWDPNKYFIIPVKERDKMNAAIPPNWNFYRYTAKPIQTYQFSAGLRKKFTNNSSLGFVVAASYRNQQNIEEDQRKSPYGDSVSGKQYYFVTEIGGIASVTYSLGANKFKFGTVYTRKVRQENFRFDGVDQNKEFIRNFASYLNFVDLLSNRLEGEHVIGKSKMRVKWAGDWSKVNRDLSDGRLIRYLGGSNGYAYNFAFDGIFPSLGGTSASTLNESKKNASLDLSLPLNFWKGKQVISVGALYSKRDVDYSYSFLRPVTQGASNPLPNAQFQEIVFGRSVDKTIIPQAFLDGYLNYRPVSVSSGGAVGGGTTTAADYYTGDQTIASAYLLGDLNLTQNLRMIAGVRLEDFNMKTNVVLERDINTGKVTKDTISELKQARLFPSINMVYKLNAGMNIRAAFSQTVARPEFRDIARVGYFDFSLPGTVNGNPELRNTTISNFDLRYEYFLSSDELISATIFYKYFKDPIEILAAIQSTNYDYKPFNLTSSTNIGAEIDFRKSLSFVSSKKFFKKLYLSGNFSYMNSTVVVDPTIFTGSVLSTKRNRPLIGLSPYSINAGFLYDGEKYGFNILYNRFGRRLVFVGDPELFDIYENPRNVLDAQVYARFLQKKLEVRLNVADILNNPFIWYSNFKNASTGDIPNDKRYNKDEDFLVKRVVKGTTIELTVNYRF
jgi:hypothetical protein